MHQCCVLGCKNVGNHIFPKDENLRKLWEAAIRCKDNKAKKYSRICSAHFKSEDFNKVGKYSGLYNTRRILKKGIVPSIFQWTKTEAIKSKQRREGLEAREAKLKLCVSHIEKSDDLAPLPNGTTATCNTLSETAAFDYGVDHIEEVVTQENSANNLQLLQNYSAGFSESATQKNYQFYRIESFRNDDKDNSQDPLSSLTDQCRFCGEFSKDCLVVSSHMPYLAGTKTTLGLNDISVQLHFNDDLPKTVCSTCNTKLQEYCDFIKAVKTAQETLKRNIKTEPEDVSEIDVFIKTEAADDEKDTNSITINDTVFVKKIVSYKRKCDVTNQKAKVAKNMVECENELLINVKQEIVDDDEHIESSRLSDDTSETLSIPDELKCNYVSEMADESTLSVSEVIKKKRILCSDTTVNASNAASDLSPQILSGDLT